MTDDTPTQAPQADPRGPRPFVEPGLFQRAELAAMANRQRLLNREAQARTIARGVRLNIIT